MLPFFKPDHLILRERTRRWVDEKGLSFSRHHGNLEERAIALVRELGAGGFLKHAVPEEFGGIRATVQARDLVHFARRAGARRCVERHHVCDAGSGQLSDLTCRQSASKKAVSYQRSHEANVLQPSLLPSLTLDLTWRPCKLARSATEMNSA